MQNEIKKQRKKAKNKGPQAPNSQNKQQLNTQQQVSINMASQQQAFWPYAQPAQQEPGI